MRNREQLKESLLRILRDCTDIFIAYMSNSSTVFYVIIEGKIVQFNLWHVYYTDIQTDEDVVKVLTKSSLVNEQYIKEKYK